MSLSVQECWKATQALHMPTTYRICIIIYTFYMLHKHSYITMIIYSIVLSQDNTEFIGFSGLHSPCFSPAYCVQHHHQKYNVDLQN